jgi:hypothetical protein
MKAVLVLMIIALTVLTLRDCAENRGRAGQQGECDLWAA